MPAKRKAAVRGRKEATDLEEVSPKRKKACLPKPRAKKSGSYKMPPPLPRGEELTDFAKHSWRLEESIGKGGFGEIYRAVPVGSTQDADYVIKIVCNYPFCHCFFSRIDDPWASSELSFNYWRQRQSLMVHKTTHVNGAKKH